MQKIFVIFTDKHKISAHQRLRKRIRFEFPHLFLLRTIKKEALLACNSLLVIQANLPIGWNFLAYSQHLPKRGFQTLYEKNYQGQQSYKKMYFEIAICCKLLLMQFYVTWHVG